MKSLVVKWFSHHRVFMAVVAGIVVIAVSTMALNGWMILNQRLARTAHDTQRLTSEIASLSAELTVLKNQDQYKRNQQLQNDISQIESTYTQTVLAYEDLLRLKDNEKNTTKFDSAFANILTLLSKKNYATASAELAKFRTDITAEQQNITASFTIPTNVPVSNAAPGSGFSQQTVNTDVGTFLVDIIAADLSTTHVYVDTAAGGTCTNDCPVLSLGEYVARNGAYAGINGGYFCPADYPSCAGKTNSFDTLLMNKNKVYFNSDNNKYSTVPAVIFGNGFIRFIGQSLEWGRDTSIDSMLANQPLLVSGGSIVFGGNGDPKMASRGTRGFVANKGNTVYIGMAFNVSVADMAHVMKSLRMENALNLDSGGSAALWFGGYKVGPGRNLATSILFVKK
jgi:exopolysaccharide biosynthesis protein